ncbi:MAG: hypothetical protein ACXAC6_12230 [Candidatus Hodarchaeales archaeon]|jgi:DNA polymerase II large subunit
MIELEFQKYVNQLKRNITAQIQIASKARNQKHDPKSSIESNITNSSTKNILSILNIPKLEDYLPKRINQHENLLLLAADVAKQTINGRFIKKSQEDLVLLALQNSFVILSRGQCSVPQEYMHRVRIDPTTKHLTIFFTNTIRHVPGVIIGLVVLISDYIRSILHLNRFQSSPDTIGRYEEELTIFLQMNDRLPRYERNHMTLFIQNIGIELTSEPYERVEVKKYRNLPKLTNHLRMGLCVALEKILHNLQKVVQQKKLAGIPEWSWLDGVTFSPPSQERDFGPKDIRSTQPLLAQSKTPGGFRIRYGLSRNIGCGTIGLHPATILITGILSPGCTVQLDLSNASYSINPVSSIMGPLVELNDNSLVRINTIAEYYEMKESIIHIWEMGDILLSPSDNPIPDHFIFSAWTEEWWSEEINSKITEKPAILKSISEISDISPTEIRKMITDPLRYHPSWNLSLILAKYTNVPIHPRFSFNWNEIAISDFIYLVQNLKDLNNQNLILDDDLVRIIKELGVQFKIKEGKLDVHEFNNFIPLLQGKSEQITNIVESGEETISVESLCHSLIGFPVRSLCSRRIGLKLIRIEKSEARVTNPPHHVLFPLGNHGGSQRDFFKINKENPIKITISDRFCESCEISFFSSFCPECHQLTTQQYICRKGHIVDSQHCDECNRKAYPKSPKLVNVRAMFNSALRKAKSLDVQKVKGVSSLNNQYGISEPLIKGILRAKHKIHVFKDGTSRYSFTNSPIRTFTPKEIHTSIEELAHLGYSHDIFGEKLTDDEQQIEIFPYDVILNIEGLQFLFSQSKFLDDELVYLYDSSPYYRLRSFENVPGLLIVGISPTSQIGVVGRVIGYTKNNVLYAHPLWHHLKSRRCNGVSDSITLFLDVLVNFSREFIPAFHGGSLDTPTIINLVDNWKDLMVFSKSSMVLQNLAFYRNLGQKSQELKTLSYDFSLLHLPPIIHHITENLSDISVENKLRDQKIINRISIALDSLRTIRAVEEGVFVDNILVNDFLNKITTSITRFFQQPFRCRICKRTYRRVPLGINCPFCHKNTLELTLSKGWVLRYMQIISLLAEQYSELSESTKSWIRYIELNKSLLFDIGPKHTTLFFDQET